MNPVTTYLQQHWVPLAAIVVGAAVLARAAGQRRPLGRLPLPGLLAGGALALFGLGGLAALPEATGTVSPETVGMIAALGALGVLFALFVVVIITGLWSAAAGYGLAGLALFGAGAWLGVAVTEGLNEAGRFALSVEPLEPGWLLLLLLIPPLVWMSYKNLAALGPVRRWVALGLRCLLVILLALALAEAHARRPDKALTVLFLWDRSLSVPPEYAENDPGRDLREERIKQFINDAVARRPPGHEADQAGLIVFGRRPRLELPPGSVPRLNLRKIHSQLDDTYTDIAAALKLALASFPEGTGKRVVLISDGNENIGQAEEQARLARQNGVQIDVVPVAAERQQVNEVLVERVEAPPQTEKGARVPLRVVIRSHHPHIVVGELRLDKVSLQLRKAPDQRTEQPFFEREAVAATKVELRPGLNVYFFQQPGAREEDAYTYEALFIPSYVRTAAGRKVADGLPGDRIENNRASVSVMARGQRAVLLVEPKLGDHKLLADRLMAAKSGLKVISVQPPSQAGAGPQAGHLPDDPTQLALVLSRFDAVILANVPADALTEDQQKVIRSLVHDQGTGLIMIGGNNGFGAGGWQGTEIEKALPVTMDLKSMKIEGKSGLVLMMHASEMAEGNAWQRKIAKLAIEKLSPMDMVGMLYYSHGNPGGHQWHIPFQQIGTNRPKILGRVDSMEPGDMPDVDPAFAKAYAELTKAEYQLGTKHIIFISDGDHWDASRPALNRLRSAKITCTTVCITTHGQTEIKKMAAVAQYVGGRSYHVKDPKELPAIYIKESRLVSQSFVHEGRFKPIVRSAHGPTEGIRDVEPLYGFVRTTRRPSPLVEVPIETPQLGEYKFPILAQWQYGLGKAIAFTSDARTLAKGSTFWDKDWANSDLYTKFWEQTTDWALRPTESGKFLRLTTEQADGKIRVRVEARESDKTPITEIGDFKAGVTVPSFKGPEGRKVELKFEQKSGGVYEAEIPAEEVGTYFLNIQARWKKDGKEVADAVRAGVTVPYSPEFAEMESNPSLLEKLRHMTDGASYSEDAPSLRDVARSGELFRPVAHSQPSLQALWPWLVLLTGLCLVLDVAARRIAIQPEAVWARSVALWGRLRGQQQAPAEPEFLERLRSRKAQVEESLDKQKTGRKFEAPAEGAPAAPVPTAQPTGPAARPAAAAPPPAGVGPAKEEEPTDFAARLLRAKKRAMEERDKKDKNQP